MASRRRVPEWRQFRMSEDIEPATIGARAKAWRKYLKLTAVQLAQRMGTTKSAISRYERGGRQVKGSTISALAKALGITEVELMKGPPKPGDPDPKNINRAVRIAEAIEGDDAEAWLAMGERFLNRKSP